jgi:hypothetical protein
VLPLSVLSIIGMCQNCGKARVEADFWVEKSPYRLLVENIARD